MGIRHDPRRRFVICIGFVCLLFYVPGNVGASTDLLTALSDPSGADESPSCNCDGSDCCCGAPCCAPVEPSCCDTTDDPCAASHQLLDDRLAFTTVCTCGLSDDRGVALVFSCDLHVITLNSIAICPPSPDTALISGKRRCHSHRPDPPEQVPKSLHVI
jgi:hypothetical protein